MEGRQIFLLLCQHVISLSCKETKVDIKGRFFDSINHRLLILDADEMNSIKSVKL